MFFKSDLTHPAVCRNCPPSRVSRSDASDRKASSTYFGGVFDLFPGAGTILEQSPLYNFPQNGIFFFSSFQSVMLYI